MQKPKALYFNSFKSWFSKKKFFLGFFAVFMTFLTRFEKTFWKKNENILTPPKKYEIGKKYQKKQHFYSNNFENW